MSFIRIAGKFAKPALEGAKQIAQPTLKRAVTTLATEGLKAAPPLPVAKAMSQLRNTLPPMSGQLMQPLKKTAQEFGTAAGNDLVGNTFGLEKRPKGSIGGALYKVGTQYRPDLKPMAMINTFTDRAREAVNKAAAATADAPVSMPPSTSA